MRIGTVVYNPPERKAVAVTTAVPWGQRDPRLPLRGRGSLLAALQGLWSGPPDGQIHVLCGMGGCGKTALAVEVAHYARQDDAHVWWVDARQPATLEAALSAVARQAGASVDELDGGDASDVLWRYLEQLKGRWLLVVDNADVPEWLDGPGRLAVGTGWVRPYHSPGGRVLVTSRDAAPATWGPGAVLHPVGPLPAEQAAQVLMDHTHGRAGPQAQAVELARQLGGLPLALRLAGAYLAETTTMPAAFRTPDAPDSFLDYGTALRPGLAQVDPGRVLARTWQMSLDLLASRGMPQAAPLLDLLCGFADAPLPYALVHPPVLAHSKTFAGVDGPRLWKLLQGLNGLGLIVLTHGHADLEDSWPTLRIHPLVRAARHSQADQTTVTALLCRVAFSDEIGPPEDINAWPRWEILSPHIAHLARDGALIDTHESLADTALAVFLAACYFQERGLYAQAKVLYQAALGAQSIAVGNDHHDALETRYRLAGLLHDMGNLEQASVEYQSVLDAERAVLGNDHPNTLSARHHLAIVLHDQGRLNEARSLLKTVLDTREATLGKNHTNTLATRHELARVLYDQGHLDQARSLLESILDAENSTQKCGNLTTLATHHELARVLYDQGHLDEARSLFESILDTKYGILGEGHPEALASRQELARVLQAQGHFDEARAEYQAVLDAESIALGNDHPSTLTTRHNLASVLCDQGHLDEARALLETVLDARIALLGKNHHRTVTTYQLLAVLLYHQGHLHQAHGMLEEALEGYRRELGEEHPRTVMTRHFLEELEQSTEHDE